MIKFWLNSPLREQAGEGAGGSGGGSGAGAGNSGAVTFDPGAFKTEILGEFNKTINGALKSLKTDFTKALEGLKPAAGGTGGGAGEGAGGSGSGTGEGAGTKGADPQVNALQLELKKEREQNAARIKALEDQSKADRDRAEQMALGGALRDALSKYDFVGADAQADAVALFTPQVQKAEDGSYVAGDLPLDKFIEQQLNGKKGYLLKPKDVSGAGARTGKAAGSKKWDLDTVLKPENFSKLTSAEQAEVRQQIASSL
jgi:hypothetical protein